MKPAGLKTADFKPATFHRFRIVAETPPNPCTSEVGRFLRKRHVCRHGPPQRSVHRRVGPLENQPLSRRSSGGFWRARDLTLPKHLRGRAISPKAPRLQTWTTAEIGPPQSWTARKSAPIQEVLRRPLEGQNQPSVTAPGGARTPFQGPLACWIGKVSMSLERTGASDVCGF
jgi:hypothetical protein